MIVDFLGQQSEQVLKTAEVATLFKVDPETVRVWVREGKLQARKNPGGRVLVFNRAEVYALLRGPEDIANDDEPARCVTTERALELRTGELS